MSYPIPNFKLVSQHHLKAQE